MLKLYPQNVKKYLEYTLIRIVILNNISFILLKKARLTTCNILRAIHGCKNNILMSLFKTYVRSILEYATVVYSPHYTYLILLLENVQRYFTKRLTGLWDINFNERITICNLEKL